MIVTKTHLDMCLWDSDKVCGKSNSKRKGDLGELLGIKNEAGLGKQLVTPAQFGRIIAGVVNEELVRRRKQL